MPSRASCGSTQGTLCVLCGTKHTWWYSQRRRFHLCLELQCPLCVSSLFARVHTSEHVWQAEVNLQSLPSCSAPYFLRFGLSLSHEAHRGAGQQVEGPAGEDASVPAFLWVLGSKLRFSSPRRAKTANHKLIDGTWQGSEQSSACLEGTEVRPGASEAHGTQP